MSSFLYRLGRRMARRAKLVLVVWLVALVGTGALAVAAGGQLQDDLTIPGTEAQEGIDVLERQFPEAAGTSGQVLFVAPAGEQVRDQRREVRQALERVEQVDHVVLVTDPFAQDQRRIALSADGRHALAQVQLDLPLEQLDERTVEDLSEAARSLPEGSSLDVHLGGSLFANTTVHLSLLEGLGVLMALVVLAVTFGSLLAAGMPIVTAILGVGVAMAGVLTVAAFTQISSSTPTLALMIGLAVGIDYALFIVSRHRGHLVGDMDVEESVARSTATAGSAVIFAGVTVVVSLLGLLLIGIGWVAGLGIGVAVTVMATMITSIILLPALLGFRLQAAEPVGELAGRDQGVHDALAIESVAARLDTFPYATLRSGPSSFTSTSFTLDGFTVQIAQKAGVDGKLFGSVTNFDIAEALAKQGFEVSKSAIRMPQGPLKNVGDHPVTVVAHSDVVVEVTVSVIAEVE